MLPLKVLLAAAAVAPDSPSRNFPQGHSLLLGRKRAWSHCGAGEGVFSSSTSSSLGGRRKKATAVVACVAGRTEQKAGSSPALKCHKHLGLTGFLVCSILLRLPSVLNSGEWVSVFAVTLISSPYP